MRTTKTDLLNGPIYKQIFFFFFPIMLGTFFQQLYNTVDAIVVGNYVGKEALAAVGGSTATFINLLINFINGLASGATVVIAQSYGARDRKGVSDGVKSGMFLGIALGALLMVVGIVVSPQLLSSLNVPADMFNESLIYMRIYLAGLIPMMVYNVGAGILRAVGDSKRPLYFLIVSCFVNIILDIILVAVFKTGVVGAAVATILSQFAAAILVIIVLKDKEAPYYYNLKKDFGFEKKVLSRIVFIGLPMGIQSVMYSVSNLFIQASVNSFGIDTVAAYTAFGKIDALYWLISGAYGAATVTIVGQCFGAGKIDRAKKSCWTAIYMLVITTVIVSAFCCLTGNFLYNLFTDDPEVIKIGMDMLLFVAPTWITFTLIEIFSSAIRACGESMKPMILTGLGICLFRVIYLLVIPQSSVIQTLYCYPLSWVLTSILFLIYYLRGNWLKRALAKNNTSLETN